MSDEHPETPILESDPRFPSGPWTGYFLQQNRSGPDWMELTLTFRQGVVTGDGRDRVGRFLLRGRYEADSGKCWWTKRYLGGHDVSYAGYNEGRGIWGTWNLSDPAWRGGFHIWPKGMRVGDDPHNVTTADAPEDESVRVSFEQVEESLEPAGVGTDSGFDVM